MCAIPLDKNWLLSSNRIEASNVPLRQPATNAGLSLQHLFAYAVFSERALDVMMSVRIAWFQKDNEGQLLENILHLHKSQAWHLTFGFQMWIICLVGGDEGCSTNHDKATYQLHQAWLRFLRFELRTLMEFAGQPSRNKTTSGRSAKILQSSPSLLQWSKRRDLAHLYHLIRRESIAGNSCNSFLGRRGMLQDVTSMSQASKRHSVKTSLAGPSMA